MSNDFFSNWNPDVKKLSEPKNDGDVPYSLYANCIPYQIKKEIDRIGCIAFYWNVNPMLIAVTINYFLQNSLIDKVESYECSDINRDQMRKINDSSMHIYSTQIHRIDNITYILTIISPKNFSGTVFILSAVNSAIGTAKVHVKKIIEDAQIYWANNREKVDPDPNIIL